MRSTMMDTPLQVSRLLQHGSTVHGSSEVITWTADGPRRTPYAEVGANGGAAGPGAPGRSRDHR
jgi:fatty-acyl-CoA synthase